MEVLRSESNTENENAIYVEILPCLRVRLQCVDSTRERDVTCLCGKKDLVVLVGFLCCLGFFFLNSERHRAAQLL